MSNSKSFLDRLNNWVKNSIGLRVVTIVFLVLILLIPVSMIQSLISERENNQHNVINEVSSKWGKRQTITALILTVPYFSYSTIREKGEEDRLVKTKHYAHFLPNDLNIDGEISPEKRYRGIYEVILYKCDLVLSGHFEKPNFKKLNIKEEDIAWKQASIAFGLTDLRSIQNDVSIEWASEKFSFDPGVKTQEVISSGISTSIPVNDSSLRYDFKVEMNFNGSSGLSFAPLGKISRVNMHSNWPEPSFKGAFLPDSRHISDSGFVATWEVLHLNRNYPQEFTGKINDLRDSNFGVDLIMPVDQYQKSMRSVKYAIMFISLTFMVYFFSQIKNVIRIHPIQYLIVGLAICLFFTLLIALSEHIHFGYAYLIGAISTIFMITAYSYFVFKNILTTQVLSGILVLLYGFIYIIIQLQDYALLIGSIGLVLILACVMYLSRNIDWYNVNKQKEE